MSYKSKKGKTTVKSEPVEKPVMPPQRPTVDLMDFDSWWALRASKIPAHHRKEVIRADFRGRGISMKESVVDFDKALEEYGIKLTS